MTTERWKILFFVSAWLSRMLCALLASQWVSIGATVLVDVPMDWSADLTPWMVALVMVPSVVLLFLLRANPHVHERMRKGPDFFLKYSMLILFAALGSAAGGIALFLTGEVRVAFWVQTLSLAVALFEIFGLVGSILLEAFRPTDPGDMR